MFRRVGQQPDVARLRQLDDLRRSEEAVDERLGDVVLTLGDDVAVAADRHVRRLRLVLEIDQEIPGEILFIEATRMPGKGRLILTGSLGEVMKESAQTALSYLRSQAEKLGIDASGLEKQDLHIHVPAGGHGLDGELARLMPELPRMVPGLAPPVDADPRSTHARGA